MIYIHLPSYSYLLYGRFNSLVRIVKFNCRLLLMIPVLACPILRSAKDTDILKDSSDYFK